MSKGRILYASASKGINGDVASIKKSLRDSEDYFDKMSDDLNYQAGRRSTQELTKALRATEGIAKKIKALRTLIRKERNKVPNNENFRRGVK